MTLVVYFWCKFHENSRGEKLGEKTGYISPLHLKYIFGVNFMKIQEGRKEVRKEVISNLLP